MDKSKRLVSLDALRGFDMMFIMGVSGLIVALCHLFPDGDNSWLAQQMTHVDWNGLRHHRRGDPDRILAADTVFPLQEGCVFEGVINLICPQRGFVLQARRHRR